MDTQNTQYYLNSDFQYKQGETNKDSLYKQNQSIYNQNKNSFLETKSFSNDYKGISGIGTVETQYQNAMKNQIHHSIGDHAIA